MFPISISISISIAIAISPSFSRGPFHTIHRLPKLHASSSSSSDTPWPHNHGDLPREALKKRPQIAGVNQDTLVDPWILADADSRFAELRGVQIHHKIARPTSSFGSKTEEEREEKEIKVSEGKENVVSCEETENAALPAMILLHGFGASLFSFERVLRPLSNVLGSPVLAFDRPAFGLTSRAKLPLELASSADIMMDRGGCMGAINPYSVSFSSSATIAFMDFVESKEAVLIGHSSGCIVAAEAYFKAPERIVAMVLVAPSLFAPFMVVKKKQILDKQQQIKQILFNVWEKILWVFGSIMRALQSVVNFIWRGVESSLKTSQRIALMVVVAIVAKKMQTLVNVAQGLLKVCLKVCEKILWAFNGIIAALPPVVAFTRSQLFRLLSFTLRSVIGISLVRVVIDKLSLAAIQMAWFNKEKFDNHVISGYTKPLKCKNWEYALLEYVIALLGDASDVANRLNDIRCPVLVITGDNDAIVPSWNAKRLTKLFPNARCKIIKNCGHLPQEEKPEEFVMVIEKFIKQVLDATHMAPESVVPGPV